MVLGRIIKAAILYLAFLPMLALPVRELRAQQILAGVLNPTPVSSGSTIAFVGTPACVTWNSQTTASVSYTPAATGHTLVVAIFLNGNNAGNATLKDQLGNSLAQLGYASIIGQYGDLSTASGVTSIVATMSGSATSVQGAMCVTEYSGVVHFGSTYPQNLSGSGSPYTNTLSATTGANNWFATAFLVIYPASISFTSTAGTIRSNYTQTNGGAVLMMQDNGPTTSGASLITSATSGTSTGWVATGVELKSQ